MEVDEAGPVGASGVLAPAATQPSVSVTLHPLVIMNVSEHYTRLKAQRKGEPRQVVGALLGKHQGRSLELMNSFEVPYDEVEGQIVIDLKFFQTRLEQYQEVFTELDFLGWYTTGAAANQADVAIHKQFCEVNESPIFLKLNPVAKPSEKLPLCIMESVIDAVHGETCVLFVELPYSLVTEEAERIGVDHVARISTAGPGTDSAVSKTLHNQHGAVKMLAGRLKLILEYLEAVEGGRLPRNEEILREAASLTHRLPVVSSQGFSQEFHYICNDISLVAYLGSLTKTYGTLNQMVNKLNVIHERHGPGTMRRGRGLLM